MAAVNLVALASLLLLATGSGSLAASVDGSRSGYAKVEPSQRLFAVNEPDSVFPSDFLAVARGNSAEEADNQGSATKRRFTRQISFDGDDRNGQRDESPFSGTKSEKEKQRVEEFDGFPDGFVTGLKPFNFEETAGSHRDATSTGFFQFPAKDNLPSFATTLGGLKRFPPIPSASKLSSSSTSPQDSEGDRAATSNEKTSSRDSFSPIPDGPSSGFSLGSGFGGTREITPDSFRETTGNDADLPERRERPDSKRGGSGGGGQNAYDDEYGQYFPYRGAGSAEAEDRRRASQAERAADRRPSGEESRNSGNRPATSEESAPVFSGFTDYEGPSSFRSSFPSSSGSDSSFPSRQASNDPTGNGESYEHQGSSSTSVKVVAPSPKTTTSSANSPLATFQDSDRMEKAEPQNFVPVGHFQNGRFSAFPDFSSDGGFRPLVNRPPVRDEPAGHAVRNFRQTSRPQFFITNEGGGGGASFDGFFGGGGGGGGGGGDDFNRAPQHHQGGGSAERFTHQRPQFHLEQRDHQRPAIQQLHGDDVTNHHSSATNLLGSGNFNIIRGGIFADDENPSASDFHGFRPSGHHHHEPPKDFFHGFRDFQPFGGSLNNALSLNSQNIQKAPSEEHTVTATTSTSTTASTPTTSSTRRSKKKSASASS